MRTLVLAILVAGCSNHWRPAKEQQPDAAGSAACLASAGYAVELVHDHGNCPTTAVPGHADPYWCSVPSLDPAQTVAAHRLEDLRCGPAQDVTATWTID